LKEYLCAVPFDLLLPPKLKLLFQLDFYTVLHMFALYPFTAYY